MSGNQRRKSGYKLLTKDEIDAALTLHDVNAKTTAAPAAPAAKARGPTYFQIPTGPWWRSLDLAPLKVWLYILEEDFRHRGSPFEVTTSGLRSCNISRWQKVRALRELAERGYVSIEWRTNRNPTVTRVHVRVFKKN